MLRKYVFPLLFVPVLVLAGFGPAEGAPTSLRSAGGAGNHTQLNMARLSTPSKTGGTSDPWGGRRSTPRQRGGIRFLEFLGSANEGEIGSQIDPNGNSSAIRVEVDPAG